MLACDKLSFRKNNYCLKHPEWIHSLTIAMNITIRTEQKDIKWVSHLLCSHQFTNIKIKSWTEYSDMYTNVSSDDQMQTATSWLSVTKISWFIL